MPAVNEHIAVQVLLFSMLREKLGRTSLEVSLEPGATGKDLLDQLCEQYTEICAYQQVVRLAVNASYVKDDVVLEAGDEVALITPVSGG
ncbi:MAG: MoaD/ThiS family protein [Bacteroidota bacterium]